MNLIGETLSNRYSIEELIGRGGMAEVYKAWDLQRQYHVALKLIREDLAEDLEFLRRFKQEANTLKNLAHSNIVRFYSLERDDNLAFLVMDYIPGITLRRRILETKGAPLPLAEVASITKQICAALYYAHNQGMIHRDIKTSNILIDPNGRVFLSDFGIAKASDSATVTTLIPGTPAYMSPEQCKNQLVDNRSDIYSLGVVIFEMLTGRRPFTGEQAQITGTLGEKVRWEHIKSEIPMMRQFNPTILPGLEQVILRCLQKNPDRRYYSVIEFWQNFANQLPDHILADPQPQSTGANPPNRHPSYSAPSEKSGKETQPKTPRSTMPVCESCGVPAETRYAVFYQLIGMIILQRRSSIKGKLCKACIDYYFWNFTGKTILFGWWGFKSFIMTPFILIVNIYRYLITRGMKPPVLRITPNPNPLWVFSTFAGLAALVLILATQVFIPAFSPKINQNIVETKSVPVQAAIIPGAQIQSTSTSAQQTLEAIDPESIIKATQTAKARISYATGTAMTRIKKSTATVLEGYKQATATREAIQVPYLPAKGWAITFMDNFHSNANNWATGIDDDKYSRSLISISSGYFSWTINSIKEPFIWRKFPDNIDQSISKAYYSVDATLIYGNSAEACYGLAFRYSETGGYTLIVCDDQTFAVLKYQNGDDENIFDWQSTDAIIPGKNNKLGIAAVEDRFTIYINEEFVYEFEDPAYKSGLTGIAISMFDKTPAQFKFDNLVVLSE